MADVIAEFWCDREQSARREYRCDACGKPIQVGARYTYTAAKCDGDLTTYRQHGECFALSRAFRDDDGHFLFGCLSEAPDYACDPSQEDMRRWVAIFQRPWPPHITEVSRAD